MPEPQKPYEIVFTNHFWKRYAQKLSQIDQSAEADRLRREIIRAGIFYLNNNGGLFCVINGLKVYGMVVDDGKLKLATTYPYPPGLRRRLAKTPRVNICGVGKSCVSGIDLQTLLDEGVNLQENKTPT